MKNYILPLIAIFIFGSNNAQDNTIIIPRPTDSRVITTAVPFLLIAPDARAAGMGDMGVATSADAYSQQWNPSKYAFSEAKSGIAVSYTPYLSRLVNDIFLGSVGYYNRINEQSAFAASFRYFSLGEIELRDFAEQDPIVEKPNELTLDVSYSLRLAQQFSMGVSMRYLRSDLRIRDDFENIQSAGSFGVDIAGYYQSEEQAYNDFNGRTRFGFAIQNLGPAIEYDDNPTGDPNFIPTTLRLGGGFDFIFDDYNKLSVTAEVTKLLVPTPPQFGDEYLDENNDGVIDDEELQAGPIRERVIFAGESTDVNFLTGVFQSFGDAPGGFSEELREFTWALGAEYLYQDSFALRAGYFNEADDKGARKFFALGAGFKYTTINIDLSYLFSASRVRSPLENTLRFSLAFNFGDGEYREY